MAERTARGLPRLQWLRARRSFAFDLLQTGARLWTAAPGQAAPFRGPTGSACHAGEAAKSRLASHLDRSVGVPISAAPTNTETSEIPEWRLVGDWWDLCNCAIGC